MMTIDTKSLIDGVKLPKAYYLLLNGSVHATKHGRRHGIAMAANISLLTSCGIPMSQIECAFAHGDVEDNEITNREIKLSTNEHAKPIWIDQDSVEDCFNTTSEIWESVFLEGVTDNDYLIVKILSHSANGTGGIMWSYGNRKTVVSMREFIDELSKKFKYRHLYILQTSSYGRQSLEKFGSSIPVNVTVVTGSLKYCYSEQRNATKNYYPLSLLALADLVTLGDYDLQTQQNKLKRYYLADASENSNMIQLAPGYYTNNFRVFTHQSVSMNRISDKHLSHIFQIDIDKAQKWLETHIVDLDMEKRCKEVQTVKPIFCRDIKPDTFIDTSGTILLPESEYDELLLDTFDKLKNTESIQEQILLRMELRDQIKAKNIQFMYLLLLLDYGNWIDLWIERCILNKYEVQIYNRDVVNNYLKIAMKHNFLILNSLVVDNYNDILCYLESINVTEKQFESAVVKVTSLPKYPFICKPTNDSTNDQRKLYLLTLLYEAKWLHYYIRKIDFSYFDEMNITESEEFDKYHTNFMLNTVCSDTPLWDHDIALRITVNLRQAHVTKSYLNTMIRKIDTTLVSI
jgi:hypothetical protein